MYFFSRFLTRRTTHFWPLAGLLALGLSLSSCAPADSYNASPSPVTLARSRPPMVLPAAPLRFFVVGDTGSKTQQQRDVAEALARRADSFAKSTPQTPVRAVVMVGDNFYEKGVQTANDPLWQEAFEDVYDKRRLSMPFFAVLGNHDWVSNPLAEIEYASKHPTSLWQMDNYWYKRQYFLKGDKCPLADLFFIDSDLWLRSEDGVKSLGVRQLVWLQNSLANSQARWKFVFAHHPLYSDGAHGHSSEVTTMRDKIGALLEKYNVDAYICGHDHDLQRIVAPQAKTLFLVSGAGGKLRERAFNDYGPFYASKPGFLLLTVSPTRLQGEFQDDEGRMLDSFTRAPLSK
jgi:acid phosphatase